MTLQFICVIKPIAIIVRILNIANIVPVRIHWHISGVQRVAHAVQFVNVFPLVVVIIAVVDVEQTVAVGVNAGVGVFFDGLFFSLSESQTSGQHQEQDHHDGRAFLHGLNHEKLGINMFPAFIHTG